MSICMLILESVLSADRGHAHSNDFQVTNMRDQKAFHHCSRGRSDSGFGMVHDLRSHQRAEVKTGLQRLTSQLY